MKKIFGDRVTTDIIDRIKEKIVNNNLQRALGASHNIKKYTNDYQEPNLALCVQTQM